MDYNRSVCSITIDKKYLPGWFALFANRLPNTEKKAQMNPAVSPWKKIIQRIVSLFTIEKMIKNTEVLGELPTTATVYRTFIKVAWPSALEAFLVGMIGVIDTIMVSKLGEGAIAAVGITNQPKFILLAVIFSLNVGITAVVARRKGQQDRASANKTLLSGMLVGLIASLVTCSLGYIFAEPLLVFCGADVEYLADAVVYFRVLAIGLVFTSLNLIINAAHRGAGYTKISMRTNIAANIVNVIFNYLLINGIGFFPRLEVKGAAIATMLGAIVSCLISLATLFQRKNYLNFFQKTVPFSLKEILTPVIKVSSSAFIEQVFMRVGFLVYAILVARLGTTAYATHLICMNILSLSFSFGDGFAVAASALVGQNLGARRPDLAAVYGKAGQRLAFLISTLLCIIFVTLRVPLVSLFSDEAVVIKLGAAIMLIIACSTHFQTSQVVLNGCLRGAGDTFYVAATSLISIAILRPGLTWLLCFPLDIGLYGAWISLIFDQLFRFFASYTRFNSNKWSKIRL